MTGLSGGRLMAENLPTPSFGPEPLTPLSFLERSAVVYGDRLALIDGKVSRSYAEFAQRCAQLSGALHAERLGSGEVVSVLASNSSMMLEAHFGVSLAGLVMNPLNTRLSAAELAFILGHAGTRLLLVDEHLLDLAVDTVRRLGSPIRVVSGGEIDSEYEAWIGSASPYSQDVQDERQPISINYTSGTTGRPKGVIYTHRGAYLQAMAMMSQASLNNSTRFLWTLPMFHCNGWCFPWAVTGAGGVHVLLQRINPQLIWDAIRSAGITHFNAAPTVLTSLVEHPASFRLEMSLAVATGGAPPSPSLISRLEALNINVTHLYGLTETYGPAVICDWRPEWDGLASHERARVKARQGVANLASRPVRVVLADGAEAPHDGRTEGEVVLRGNVVMSGYFKDPIATAEATIEGPGGSWFRTGDIGVIRRDGYLELRDRSKDVIISGGENIASIEVEQALSEHHAVVECAVVAAPDERWGEVPVAFVVLRAGSTATEGELIDYVRSRIARFKAPKRVLFGDLPRTSTGKVQKFLLRERLR
jgi:fatty-acyl-CoA synthase